jgi:hypothetical protein
MLRMVERKNIPALGKKDPSPAGNSKEGGRIKKVRREGIREQ